MPIIDLQRRMVEVGRIRAGDFTDGHPRKLEHWRLTSQDRQRLDCAAGMWGGTVAEWSKRPGEFELYTETAVLPIMLIPETEASLWYEDWTRGGCQRRCDGVTEMLSDGPCLCDGDARQCKPHLRFPVMLPDLPGIGSWLVQSTGWNAAGEIPQTVQMLGRASAQGVLIPARLRLEQRVEVKSGQTRRFAVPVVDVDVALRDLIGGQQAALPSGYTPLLSTGNGVTLEQSMEAAETQVVKRTPRSAAAIPDVGDVPFGDFPVPVDDPASGAAPSPAALAAGSDKPLTAAQKKNLNRLVGTLRDGGHITTENLYAALATARSIDADTMSDVLHGRDEEGVLHWSPLRDSLTKDEASGLIDRLTRLEQNVGAAA